MRQIRISHIIEMGILMILGGFCIIHGARINEIGEVIVNGITLCLACVGIG